MTQLTKVFVQAESFRTEETRKMDLKGLCDKMALGAGWKTVFVSNNRSKVKDRVKYERPFDNSLFCELLCRFQSKIYQQFLERGSINLQQAPSKVYDVVLRFMNTYKPEEAQSSGQIVNRMLMSIRQRAIECHHEEVTKYTMEDSSKGCHLELSLNQTFKIGKEGDEKELGDTIEDKAYSNRISYAEDLEELEAKYATSESQKILLNILLSTNKKMTASKLLAEYLEETGESESIARKVVYSFYKNLKESLAPKLAK